MGREGVVMQQGEAVDKGSLVERVGGGSAAEDDVAVPHGDDDEAKRRYPITDNLRLTCEGGIEPRVSAAGAGDGIGAARYIGHIPHGHEEALQMVDHAGRSGRERCTFSVNLRLNCDVQTAVGCGINVCPRLRSWVGNLIDVEKSRTPLSGAIDDDGRYLRVCASHALQRYRIA